MTQRLPSPAGTRAARKAATRAAILDAATALFARRGIAATSLDQIADAVGLTKGAVYASFPSKRALVEAAAERISIPTDFAVLLRADLSLEERLRRWGRWLTRTQRGLSRQVTLFDLEYFTETLRDPAAGAVSRRRHRDAAREMGARLRAVNARRGERTPVDEAEFVFAMIALGRGLLQTLALEPGAISARNIETLLALLAGKGARRPRRSS